MRPEYVSWKRMRVRWKRRKGRWEGGHEVQSFASSSAEALGCEDCGFAEHTFKFRSDVFREGEDLFNKAPEWKSWVCFKEGEKLLVVSEDKV
jgi:hypothetical protein